MKLFFIFIILLQSLTGQTVTATVDVNQLSVNETFTFKVEAQNSNQMPQVDLSPLGKDFTVISGPAQQTSFQFINGKSTSSKSLTWTLVANKKGNLVIPALVTIVDGKKLSTNPIPMSVKSVETVSQQNELFLSADVDKKDAYVGEQVTVTYKLYTRVQMSLTEVQNPEYVGFWTETLSVPNPPRFNQTSINGVQYNVATLYKVALFPTKSGELELAPMTATCNVQVKTQRRQRSLFDDPFFDNFFTETVQKVLRTDPKVIKVKPYPSGQPANFSGAVGQFKIKSNVDIEKVKVNEAVTFFIELEGTGNLNMFSLPELNFPENMEVFPPKSTFEQEQLWDQFTGKLKWEYILIPRQAGKIYLPRIELAYFDPQDEQFHKINSAPVQLNIAPAKNNLTHIPSGFTKEEITLLGQDIHYNITSPPSWIERGNQKVPIWIVTSYLLTIGLFLTPVTMSRLKNSRMSTAGQRLSHRSLKKALHAIKQYPEIDQLSNVVYTYLKERWQLKTDKMDPVLVQKELHDNLAAEDLAKLFQLLQDFDAYRYSPVAAENMDIIAQTISLLKKIDSGK